MTIENIQKKLSYFDLGLKVGKTTNRMGWEAILTLNGHKEKQVGYGYDGRFLERAIEEAFDDFDDRFGSVSLKKRYR